MNDEEKIPRQPLFYDDTGEEEIEIDLLDLGSQLLKRWMWIALIAILGAVIAGVWSYYMLTPTFKATSKLYMVSTTEGSMVNFSELNLGTSLAADYSELIRIRDVAEAVIEELSLPYSYEQIESMLTVETVPNTRIMKISIVDSKPEEAMQIANMVAEATQRILPERTGALKPKIVEYAVLPKHKNAPNYTHNIMIGGLAGLFLAAGFFTFLYIIDNTFHTEEDFERVFHMQPLAIVPEGDISAISDKVETGLGSRRKKKKKTANPRPVRKGDIPSPVVSTEDILGI